MNGQFMSSEPYIDLPGRAELSAIVAEAYGRWEHCPLPETLDVCTHCTNESIVRRLRETPVRCIGPNLMYEYHSSAHSNEWYGKAPHDKALHDEIRHFLPRQLELLGA